MLLSAVQGNGMEAKEEPYQEESPTCDDPNMALPVLAEPGDRGMLLPKARKSVRLLRLLLLLLQLLGLGLTGGARRMWSSCTSLGGFRRSHGSHRHRFVFSPFPISKYLAANGDSCLSSLPDPSPRRDG